MKHINYCKETNYIANERLTNKPYLNVHLYTIVKFNKKTNYFEDNRYNMKYGLHYPDSSHYHL